MTKILVVAELRSGEVRKPTLELLSKTKGDGLDTDAVLVGKGVKDKADVLAGYGAKTVYVADDDALEIFAADRYTAAVADAAKQSGATQVWFSVSELGKALAPAVAGRLDGGFISDITSVELNGDEVTVQRPVMATKAMQTMRFKGSGVRVMSIRGGTFPLTPSDPQSANVVALDTPQGDGRLTAKELISEQTGEIDLGDAPVVVSVGRGVKGPEGIEGTVKPLSDLLGAAMGASRAVVDSGWMPLNTQVGQTGRVVTPDLYFAVGISGAIQHLAGMSGAKTIVAVNKDPDAPIFSVADYGIVGDLFKVVPVLTEELRKHKES